MGDGNQAAGAGAGRGRPLPQAVVSWPLPGHTGQRTHRTRWRDNSGPGFQGQRGGGAAGLEEGGPGGGQEERKRSREKTEERMARAARLGGGGRGKGGPEGTGLSSDALFTGPAPLPPVGGTWLCLPFWEESLLQLSPTILLSVVFGPHSQFPSPSLSPPNPGQPPHEDQTGGTEARSWEGQ